MSGMRKTNTAQVAIRDIMIAERIRKDNGSLEALAEDIRRHGLLNPITVMEKAEGGYVLIAGLRRLKAVEQLGQNGIRATIMSPMEADEMLMLEISENEQRKEFTVSEKLAYAEKLTEIETEKARVRMGDHARNNSAGKEGVADRPHLESQGKARDIVAQKAGFTSATQMRRAQALSEKRPDLMEQVDKGEKSIYGAFADMQRETDKPAPKEKPAHKDALIDDLIQEKPVELPAFEIYRPNLEPAPGNVRTIKGADHEHLMENPIYSKLYDHYNEVVQQVSLVRGEMRTRCEGYERQIRGYAENVQTLQRRIESLRQTMHSLSTENERLRGHQDGVSDA